MRGASWLRNKKLPVPVAPRHRCRKRSGMPRQHAWLRRRQRWRVCGVRWRRRKQLPRAWMLCMMRWRKQRRRVTRRRLRWLLCGAGWCS